MDESIRKALEEKFNVKPKAEVKAPATEESLHVESETEVKESIIDLYTDPEVDKKIMSFFESVNSQEEEVQQLTEACNWLMKEYGCTEEKADDVIGNILMSSDYEFHQSGCIFTILIAIISTLSLYFVM